MDAYAFTAVAMAGALLSWFFVVLLGLLLNILIGFVTDDSDYSFNHRLLPMVLMAKLLGYRPGTRGKYCNRSGSKSIGADNMFLLGVLVCVSMASILSLGVTGNPAGIIFMAVVISPWLLRAIIRKKRAQKQLKAKKFGV